MSEKKKTAWVISSGEYSDYRVLCVVRGGKKAAKMLAARANANNGDYRDDYRAEEISVVEPDVERAEVLTLASEIMDTGTAKDRDPRIRVEWPFDALFGAPELAWRWVRAPMYHDKGGRLEVWGTDHERVRKVFGDRRAMLMVDDVLRSRNEATGGR